MKKYHAMAIPTDFIFVGEAINCGIVSDENEAREAITRAGYKILEEGGIEDQYDSEDAPLIYEYEPDGYGSIGISVEFVKQ